MVPTAPHMIASSSSVRTRSRLVSGAGFSTCAAGSPSMMSRAAAQRNSRLTWASVRLAMILASRSAMPSISAMMSRLRMSSIGRVPQTGSTSRRMIRSTSFRDRLPAWSRLSHSATTAEISHAGSGPRSMSLTLGKRVTPVSHRGQVLDGLVARRLRRPRRAMLANGDPPLVHTTAAARPVFEEIGSGSARADVKAETRQLVIVVTTGCSCVHEPFGNAWHADRSTSWRGPSRRVAPCRVATMSPQKRNLAVEHGICQQQKRPKINGFDHTTERRGNP